MDYEVSEQFTAVESALAEFIIQTNKMFRKGEQETKALREEMKDFKDEMKEFKDESWRNTRSMNKKWGEVTNKLGTFAEDMAAPNIPRIAKTDFGCQAIDYYAVRIDKADPSNPGEMAEFDGIVISGDKVFLLETKFTVRMKYIEGLPDLLQKFQRCFPEYTGKQLIPLFASMSIPDNVVKRLSKLGFYAMTLGDETMDIINFDQVIKTITL
jgi:hypothetical protein